MSRGADEALAARPATELVVEPDRAAGHRRGRTAGRRRRGRRRRRQGARDRPGGRRRAPAVRRPRRAGRSPARSARGRDAMIPMTVAEIADVVGGTLHDGADPDAVVTARAFVDSRDVEPGGLFACVVGERVDGHDFVADAFGLGAVLALAGRPVGAPAVVVPDVVEALGRLATHLLTRLPEPDGGRHHGLVGQDLDEGPARPGRRPRGTDGRSARVRSTPRSACL